MIYDRRSRSLLIEVTDGFEYWNEDGDTGGFWFCRHCGSNHVTVLLLLRRYAESKGRRIRSHCRHSSRLQDTFGRAAPYLAPFEQWPARFDPDDLRREVLYPVLDRCGIKRTPRADGFHAFRRATSKYLRKASGLELAAVQLGHKRMTTTDEHYNDRDMDDLKKAAELVEGSFISSFAPDC